MWIYETDTNTFALVENGIITARLLNDEKAIDSVPDYATLLLDGKKAKALQDVNAVMAQKDTEAVTHLGFPWKSTYEAAGAFFSAAQLAQNNNEETCTLIDLLGDQHAGVSLAETVEIARLAGSAYRARYLGCMAKIKEIMDAGTIEALEAITLDW